jgi:glutaryl-CoA dehydrogenase
MSGSHGTPGPLNPRDIVDIDTLLTEDEKAIRATVRQVCDDLVEPHIMQWYEAGDLPAARELAREFGKVGLLGMHLEGYGCAGMSAVDYGLACVELEASGLRHPVAGLGAGQRWRCSRSGASGTEEQKHAVAARAWPPARRSAASG